MSATVTNPSYRGPERRHFRLLRTLNSEYHCRDDACIAVRDRHTGEFVRDHPAIGRRLSGSMLLTPDGIGSVSPPDSPAVGEQLCFSSGDVEDPHNVLTSTLSSIERPPKEVVARYRS
jgi:hypothetical protein